MGNIWLEKHDEDEQEFIWQLESVVGLLNAGEISLVEAAELMLEMAAEQNMDGSGYGIKRNDIGKWQLLTP